MSTFLQLIHNGGYITGLIFFLGFITMVIIIERLFHFHRAQINTPEFLRGLFNVLKRGGTTEAVSICDETPGPIPAILRSAILHRDGTKKEIMETMQEASLTEIPRLERHLGLLNTITALAPLLGLLGTVLGMISLFQHIQAGGAYVETKTLARGIWKALISTAAGLSVAIPAQGFYNLFVTRLNNLTVELEKAGMEMIYFLTHPEAATDKESESDGTDLDSDKD